MKQTIRFKGLSLNRDELLAEHGELSLCGNLELHDGALRPSLLSGSSLAGGNVIKTTLSATVHDVVITEEVICKLLFVHVTPSYKHYISVASSATVGITRLCWSVDDGSSWTTTQISGFDASGIRSISAVGNTLCIMKPDGLHYIICKNTLNSWSYTYLGQQPPFFELQFNLKKADNSDNTERTAISTGGLGDGVVPEELRTSVTEKVMALVNKRIDKITGDGVFYAPFLIRYCYRLYDGSMVMHSSPVLLFPCLKHPVMNSGEYLDDSDRPNVGVDVVGVAVFVEGCELQAKRLSDNTLIDSLQNWSDIVKSVDIFITPQFSRIDTSKQIETFSKYYEDNIPSIIDGKEEDIADAFYATYYGSSFRTNLYGFDLPEYSESEYFDRIKNASSFFKLASFPVETLASDFDAVTFEDLEFDKNKFRYITTQEQMKDDYKTHNLLMPNGANGGGMYVYNHRLNVYNISEKLFAGFSPLIMFPYFDPTYLSDGGVECSGIDTYVQTNDGLRKLSLDAPTGTSWALPSWYVRNGYCFYPDSRAIQMDFNTLVDGYTVIISRPLTSAAALNGALSFMNNDTAKDVGASLVDDVVPMPNKIYTSRADNPFYFPNLPDESGINSVGTGEIIGIAAVTRALSQGQVGDHDLAVFATDGIWVLKVSTTGTYRDLHNISREVCINQDSICQLDQSIFFATSRSLSRFVESDVISASEVLDGPYFDIKSKMKLLYDYFGDAGTQQSPNPNYDEAIKKLMDFHVSLETYFKAGRVIYDFILYRILILSEDTSAASVALVYSIRDGAWSTLYLPAINAAVNSYPSPYIQYDDGSVVCLDKPYEYIPEQGVTPTPTKGLIVTRTLSFSDTMDVLRGFRQYTDAATIPLMFFYGSNDQRNWRYIGQTEREFYNYLPGHPYRFFRIGIFMNMYPSEEYQAMELEVVNKYAKL